MKQTYIEFAMVIAIRLAYALAAAGLLSWVWNWGIAWEFNLPQFGYWLWVATILGLRFTLSCWHFGMSKRPEKEDS